MYFILLWQRAGHVPSRWVTVSSSSSSLQLLQNSLARCPRPMRPHKRFENSSESSIVVPRLGSLSGLQAEYHCAPEPIRYRYHNISVTAVYHLWVHHVTFRLETFLSPIILATACIATTCCKQQMLCLLYLYLYPLHKQ